MEWLVLRLHRLHVEKFGPLTSDLSNWVRVIKEFRASNAEIKAQIRRMEEEGRVFNERIAEIKRDYSEFERKINEGLRR